MKSNETTNKSIVEIKNLTVKNENCDVLINNVSVNIREGEIFGIVGESGSGKTLTAKSIINLIPEDLYWKANEIKIDGNDLNSVSQPQKRQIIGLNTGFIPQNTIYYLHPMMKIKSQICDGYMLYKDKSKKHAINRATELLKGVGFENPDIILNCYPWQLSGGMRQRVNIAMAMMNNPKLLIADEPTTALDSTIQKQVVDLFKDINENLGTTVILISHDLGLIKHYCHNIVVMYAGQIVESCSAEELFNNPKHPYTQMLIKIIPSLNMKKSERLAEIPGYVAEKNRGRSGCIFSDRCPQAFGECFKSVRENVINGEHYFKCNL